MLKHDFPNAELIFALHQIEQRLLQFANGIMEETRFIPKNLRSRDMGRAHGFLASAHIITDRINRIDKQLLK